MIRLVTATFAFAVLLCAWIIFDPVALLKDRLAGVADGAEVTRADAPQILNASLMPAPAVDTVIAGAELPAGTVQDAAAYAASVPSLANAAAAPVPMMNSAADKILAATVAVQNRQTLPQIRTDESSITDTTAGILAGLGLQAPAEASGGDQLALTASALAGISAATGRAVQDSPQTALQELVVAALKSGETDAAIDAAVNAAALSGQVTVPEMLVTSDGRVDTAVLLASIVAQAQMAAGGAAPAVPEIVGGSGVEVRVVQRADATEAYRFYTVSPGDSLGAIAVKFYGSVEHFPTIFEANRDILSSPDLIQAGQRLVIPELS